MAELLIRAKGHWMDGADTSKMTKEELASYEARSQKGDIIVVRPDGWKWGKEECLPNFIVVKTAEPYEEAKKYEESLNESVEKYDELTKETVTESKMIRHWKHNIDVAEVTRYADMVKDFDEITPVNLTSTIRVKTIPKVIDGEPIKKDS